MKANNYWAAVMLLGMMLAAGGCEENGEDVPQPGSLAPSPLSSSAALNPSPAGALLTMEEAISSVKQLHGHNGEVRFSAELQRGADYEGEKRNIWRVEALFPAGEKWLYSLDAADGKLLVLKTAPALQEEKDAPAFKPNLTVTGHNLRLDWDKTLHPDVTVMQTLESPEANKLAVHLVRRLAYVKGRERFLLDVVMVDPAGKSLQSVPLADVLMNDGMDSYTGSSFAMAHGFVQGEKLILTKPAIRQGKIQCDVQSLDIRTGQTTLLAQNVIAEPGTDWLAKGWLSSAGDKLYLNMYQSGELWAVDLYTGQAQKTDVSFPHLWPLISIYPSPDGDRFIYLGKQGDLGLYAADGKQLAQLPGKEGVYNTPPAAWSPDGRCFALGTTPGDTAEDVVWRGENRISAIAPKQVLLFDRDGRQVADIQAEQYKPGGRIELAGWLADSSAAVLHAFKLEQREDVPERGESAYYLMDSGNPGAGVSLAKADRVEDMERPEAILSKNSGRLVFVDRASRRYWAEGNDNSEVHNEQRLSMSLVSAPGQEPLRWTASQGGTVILHSYSPASRKMTQTPLPDSGTAPKLIGPDMVYTSAEGYLQVEMP